MKQIEKALLGLLINYQKNISLVMSLLLNCLYLIEQSVNTWLMSKRKLKKRSKNYCQTRTRISVGDLKAFGICIFLKHQNIAADQGMSEMEFLKLKIVKNIC